MSKPELVVAPLTPFTADLKIDAAALRRALMCGTKLLLLDEPFEGVAPALAHRLAEVVADLKREGMSVILSESDLQHSERMVDKIIVIDRGSITSID